MPTRYDIWKTASPPEYDLECCEECFVPDGDGILGVAVGETCSDEDCICHWTKEEWKAQRADAERDNVD